MEVVKRARFGFLQFFVKRRIYTKLDIISRVRVLSMMTADNTYHALLGSPS